MMMFEWILVLLLAAVILTNLAERLAVPYPSLLAIAGVGLAFLAAARVINLAKHQPPSDLALIATKASLVVRNDLHPAACRPRRASAGLRSRYGRARHAPWRLTGGSIGS